MRISKIAAFIAVQSFIVVASAATPRLEYKTNVVCDGKSDEWSSPLPLTDKTIGIKYDIANDDKNLYLIMEFTESATQTQLTSNGFEIWINVKGKNKKVTGITYPMPLEKTTDAETTTNASPMGMFGGGNFGGGGFGEGGGRNRRFEQTETSVEDKKFVISQNLTLTGFLIANGKQPARGCEVKTGLSLALDGSLIYELAIPFNTFYKEKLDQDDVKQKFAVCFVVKKDEAMENMRRQMSSAMMGMGMSPNDMGGMRGAMQSIGAAKESWIKFIPAVN